MAGDDIIIRVEADIKNFDATIQTLIGKIEKLETSVGTMGKRVGSAMKEVEDSSTAAAVKFQTFTQGALNLSTSFAQLYTSTSNLKRVNNEHAASIVSVERAQDQLLRKEIQLNREVEKNGQNSAKAILIRRQIATASDDLKVKIENEKLAQDKINDTYVLFATNVANVAFGAIQTLKTMRDLHVVAIVKETIATKLLQASQASQAATTVVSKDAITGMTLAHGGAIASTVALTGATHGLTNAMRIMWVASGIGAAITAVSIAYEAYVNNWGKFGDMVNGALGIQKEHKDLVDETTTAYGDLTTAVGQYSDKVDTMFSKMKDISAILTVPRNLAQYQTGKIGERTRLLEEAMKYQNEHGVKNDGLLQQAFADNGPEFGSDEYISERARQMAGIIQSRKFESSPLYAGLQKQLEPLDAKNMLRERIKAEKEILAETTKTSYELNKQVSIHLQLLAGKRAYGELTEKEYQFSIKALEIAKNSLQAERDKARAKKDTNDQQREYNRLIEELKKKLVKVGLNNGPLGPHGEIILDQINDFIATYDRHNQIQRDREFMDFGGGGFLNGLPFSGYQNFINNTYVASMYQTAALHDELTGATMNLKQILEDYKNKKISADAVRNALQAYYANISMIQDKYNSTANIYGTTANMPKMQTGKFATLGGYGILGSGDYSQYILSRWSASNVRGDFLDTFRGQGRSILEAIRSGTMEVSGANILRVGTPSLTGNIMSAGQRAAFRGNVNSGSSKARRGHHGHGNRNNSAKAYEESLAYQGRSGVISDLQMELGYLGLDPQLGNIPNPAWDVPSWTTNGYTRVGNMWKVAQTEEGFQSQVRDFNDKVALANAILLQRLAPIGITSISAFKSMITNPQIEDDVDNMLRFQEKLDRISTGATII